MTPLKQFTAAELAKLGHKSNLHLLIHGKVYDVHDFVHEHPGGDLVLLGEGGRDASKAWDDVQHSAEARELMKDYLVGYSFEPASDSQKEPSGLTPASSHYRGSRQGAVWAVAIALLIAAILTAKML